LQFEQNVMQLQAKA